MSDKKDEKTNVKLVDFNTKQSGAALDVDHVLQEAKGNYQSALIIGWSNDGKLDVRSSTNINVKDIVFLVETFKHKLMSGDFRSE